MEMPQNLQETFWTKLVKNVFAPLFSEKSLLVELRLVGEVEAVQLVERVLTAGGVHAFF